MSIDPSAQGFCFAFLHSHSKNNRAGNNGAHTSLYKALDHQSHVNPCCPAVVRGPAETCDHRQPCGAPQASCPTFLEMALLNDFSKRCTTRMRVYQSRLRRFNHSELAPVWSLALPCQSTLNLVANFGCRFTQLTSYVLLCCSVPHTINHELA